MYIDEPAHVDNIIFRPKKSLQKVGEYYNIVNLQGFSKYGSRGLVRSFACWAYFGVGGRAHEAFKFKWKTRASATTTFTCKQTKKLSEQSDGTKAIGPQPNGPMPNEPEPVGGGAPGPIGPEPNVPGPIAPCPLGLGTMGAGPMSPSPLGLERGPIGPEPKWHGPIEPIHWITAHWAHARWARPLRAQALWARCQLASSIKQQCGAINGTGELWKKYSTNNAYVCCLHCSLAQRF